MKESSSKSVSNIVFLESNIKRATVKSFLGSDYAIFATGGHLLSLKKTGQYNLGVDLLDFNPSYEVIGNKGNLINFWKDYISKNKGCNIFIATDPDREGEGIAREVVDLLNLEEGSYKRLFFHEITYGAVKNSLENPLNLNRNLVDAQMAREVLDRMIGFCLSSLLQKKMGAWSAGRVQSVVLKLIVDREKEILNYSSKREFLISAKLRIGRKSIKIFQLEKSDSSSLQSYKDYEQAQADFSKLETRFNFLKKESKSSYFFPKLPLTTSLLLYESKVNLGYSIQKTTSIAQKLYEGIILKNRKKRVSLITYPRTDSSRVSKFFISKISSLLKENWGEDAFRVPNFEYSQGNKKNIQNAHEAIRPTYLEYSPEKIFEEVEEKEIFNVYKLIYDHTFASFMKPAKYSDDDWFFSNNDKVFVANERVLVEKGFFSVLPSKSLSRYRLVNSSFFEKEKDFEIKKEDLAIEENVDKAPKRYTEGTLIKKLEFLGIGRPSTYNSFSKIILKRRYSTLEKNTFFIPTELGFKVNEWLQKRFSFLINENYTALLEEELDKISDGYQNYKNFISNFWKNFFDSYKLADNIQ